MLSILHSIILPCLRPDAIRITRLYILLVYSRFCKDTPNLETSYAPLEKSLSFSWGGILFRDMPLLSCLNRVLLHEMLFESVADGVRAGCATKLAVDRSQVSLHGVEADREMLGHLVVAQPLRHQSQHV